MKYNTLPGTELAVSEVCLGTMTWGEQNTRSQAHEQLDYAVAQGINFIDTAEMYPVPPNGRTQGHTETILGHWLAQPAARQARRRDQGRGARPARLDPRAAAPTSRATSSRRRAGRASRGLRTDYIDLYPDPLAAAQRADVRRASNSIRRRSATARRSASRSRGWRRSIKAGKIRHYGLSNETTWGVCEFHRVAQRARRAGPGDDCRTATASCRAASDNDLAEALFREKMSLLAYSPLAMGALTGKYLNGAKPAGARFTLFADVGVRFRTPIVFEAVEAYAKLAKRRGLTLVAARARLRAEAAGSSARRSSARRRWRSSPRTSRPRSRRSTRRRSRRSRRSSRTTRIPRLGIHDHRRRPARAFRSSPTIYRTTRRSAVASRLADVRLRAGDWLIHEGEQPSFFLLLEGRLELFKMVHGVERGSTSTAPASTSARCRCSWARRPSRACARRSPRASPSSTARFPRDVRRMQHVRKPSSSRR